MALSFRQITLGLLPYASLQHQSRIIVAIIEGVRKPADPDTLASLPTELGELLLQCWTKEPERRPTTEQCLEALRKLVILASSRSRGTAHALRFGLQIPPNPTPHDAMQTVRADTITVFRFAETSRKVSIPNREPFVNPIKVPKIKALRGSLTGDHEFIAHGSTADLRQSLWTPLQGSPSTVVVKYLRSIQPSRFDPSIGYQENTATVRSTSCPLCSL